MCPPVDSFHEPSPPTSAPHIPRQTRTRQLQPRAVHSADVPGDRLATAATADNEPLALLAAAAHQMHASDQARTVAPPVAAARPIPQMFTSQMSDAFSMYVQDARNTLANRAQLATDLVKTHIVTPRLQSQAQRSSAFNDGMRLLGQPMLAPLQRRGLATDIMRMSAMHRILLNDKPQLRTMLMHLDYAHELAPVSQTSFVSDLCASIIAQRFILPPSQNQTLGRLAESAFTNNQVPEMDRCRMMNRVLATEQHGFITFDVPTASRLRAGGIRMMENIAVAESTRASAASIFLTHVNLSNTLTHQNQTKHIISASMHMLDAPDRSADAKAHFAIELACAHAQGIHTFSADELVRIYRRCEASVTSHATSPDKKCQAAIVLLQHITEGRLPSPVADLAAIVSFAHDAEDKVPPSRYKSKMTATLLDAVHSGKIAVSPDYAYLITDKARALIGNDTQVAASGHLSMALNVLSMLRDNRVAFPQPRDPAAFRASYLSHVAQQAINLLSVHGQPPVSHAGLALALIHDASKSLPIPADSIQALRVVATDYVNHPELSANDRGAMAQALTIAIRSGVFNQFRARSQASAA